jgi:hypothetical protein
MLAVSVPSAFGHVMAVVAHRDHLPYYTTRHGLLLSGCLASYVHLKQIPSAIAAVCHAFVSQTNSLSHRSRFAKYFRTQERRACSASDERIERIRAFTAADHGCIGGALRCCGVMCTEADVSNATDSKLPTAPAAFSAGPCWSTTGGRRLMLGGPVCLRWFDSSRSTSSRFFTTVTLRPHILAHTPFLCEGGELRLPTPLQSCETKESSPSLCCSHMFRLFAIEYFQRAHLPLDAPCFCPFPWALCKASISGRVKPSRDHTHTKYHTNTNTQALEHTHRAESRGAVDGIRMHTYMCAEKKCRRWICTYTISYTVLSSCLYCAPRCAPDLCR